jgi:hypothetical protein
LFVQQPDNHAPHLDPYRNSAAQQHLGIRSDQQSRFVGSSKEPELPILPSTQQEWQAAWAPLPPALLPAWGAVKQQTDDSTSQQQQQHQDGQQGLQQQRQQKAQQAPCSWPEYYQLRGIPLDSPAGGQLDVNISPEQ